METINRSIAQPHDDNGPGSGVQNIPQYAFVLGVARSGTSAMARLLNAHPSVCIGLERYKRFYRRERAFPLELLTKERFFSFDPKDTNHRPGKGGWERLYNSMAEKWDSASIIGDKEGYAAIDYIVAGIPSPRIIFMLRDVNQVASSWNTRARNPEDAWPGDYDYRIAVNRWNEANSLAYFYAKSLGERLFILDYDKFFSGSNEYANSLLRFLGLDPDERQFMEAYGSSVQHYRDVVSRKEPLLLEGQVDFIQREANRLTYRQLSDLANSRLAS